MASEPRTYVISATANFDGTTELDPSLWQPVPDPEQSRLAVSVETVGRVSFKDLLRSGVATALVLARSLHGSASLLMTQHSATSGEIGELVKPDDPVPFVLDASIVSIQLSTAWSRPLLLDSTDALTFSGGRNTVVLLLFELGEGFASIAVLEAMLAGTSSPEFDEVTITNAVDGATQNLPVATGSLVVNVAYTARGSLAARDSSEVNIGSVYYLRRSADNAGTPLIPALCKVTLANPSDTLNGVAGGFAFLGPVGSQIALLRVPGGYVTSDNALSRPVPAITITTDNYTLSNGGWPGTRFFRHTNAGPNVATLPTSEIPIGCRGVWLPDGGVLQVNGPNVNIIDGAAIVGSVSLLDKEALVLEFDGNYWIRTT